MEKKDVKELQTIVEGYSSIEIIKWAIIRFGAKNITFASSMGIEDQILTQMLRQINKDVSIFTIDTGRLHQQTYTLMDQTMEKFDFKYEVLFPNQQDIEGLTSKQGLNSFYESIEKRKNCCYLRKVKPLKRKLSTVTAWICGLRREQSVTRDDLKNIEWDENFNLVKLNPLIDWTDEQVWDYINSNQTPINPLHNEGYISMGCVPCTRTIRAGEDARAGRWWWESPEHKECGLHKRRS